MADQRNFRSSYLERIGIKGIEEKKSLEILLNEQVLDIKKLEQFCLRFPVPASYRPYLWKILLDVAPAHQDAREFVLEQQRQQYADLHGVLLVMRRIDNSTALAHQHLRMFLIEEGTLPLDEKNMFTDPVNQAFIAMSEAMSEIVEDSVDIYWLTAQFYRHMQKNKDLPTIMRDNVERFLKLEDSQLLSHLQKLQAFSGIPLMQWLLCCFAGILPDTSLERLWDRVIAGCYKHLVFVAVAVLISVRRSLLAAATAEDLKNVSFQIPEEGGDIVTGKTFDMWQKYGTNLATVCGHSDVTVSTTMADNKSVS